MSDLYLLVCEGPTDIEIIKAVAAKISQIKGRDIEIRELSPTRDATTKRYPEHGWKGVRGWCRLYGDGVRVGAHQNAAMANAMLDAFALNKAKNSKNWRALVAIEKAKGVIIQMDTDIAHDLNVNGLRGVSGDRAHCHAAISNWLGLTENAENLYYLLPSFATENWILAMHDESDAIFNGMPRPINYESISEPCDVMVSGGYKSYFSKRKQKHVLDKDCDLYKKYGEQIGNKIDVVKSRCAEFDALCKHL
ncbi:hypothetical protein SJS82_19270 [Aeromonas media]|uniref:DUF4276 family protein n=1 Tax=Aeromonas media TaxID=651 RepID=A0AAP6L2V2_AERME|nr:hypothetical protein [Aeromonas media]MDX7924070.1 hypothetical protein [Aeromonas media]